MIIILQVLGIAGCALIMSSLIYIGMYLDKIASYIDSIKWIQVVQNWIDTFPEFVKIFLGVFMILLFVAWMVVMGKKIADGDL